MAARESGVFCDEFCQGIECKMVNQGNERKSKSERQHLEWRMETEGARGWGQETVPDQSGWSPLVSTPIIRDGWAWEVGELGRFIPWHMYSRPWCVKVRDRGGPAHRSRAISISTTGKVEQARLSESSPRALGTSGLGLEECSVRT